jgi:hypothetical protein
VQLRDAKAVKTDKENLVARVELLAEQLANYDSEALKALSLVRTQATEAEQEKTQLQALFDQVPDCLETQPHRAVQCFLWHAASSVGYVCAGEEGEGAPRGRLEARQHRERNTHHRR